MCENHIANSWVKCACFAWLIFLLVINSLKLTGKLCQYGAKEKEKLTKELALIMHIKYEY